VAELAEKYTKDNWNVAKLAQKSGGDYSLHWGHSSSTAGSQEVTGSTPVFSTTGTTIYCGSFVISTYILYLTFCHVVLSNIGRKKSNINLTRVCEFF